MKVQRYEDVIESMKRLVEAERKRTRQVWAVCENCVSVRSFGTKPC